MHEVLAKLLEAHVAHELSNWHGEHLERTLRERVSALFRWFSTVELEEVVTRAQIGRVIERYVIELRVSGGITELTGEMSRLVYTSRAASDARLDQLLTAEMYEEFADKVLALDGVRRTLIELIAQSSTAQTISARLLARAVLDLVALGVAPVRNVAPSSLTLAANKLASRILPMLESFVALALARHRDRMTPHSDEHLLELRSVVDDVWARVSPMRLSDVFATIQERDVEDFVVLAYEFWLRYRKTEFFRRISTEVIDYFFQKYERATLQALIDDMGVSEEMVAEAVIELLQPLLDHAASSGALESGIRARLESFYGSPEAAVQVESVLRRD